MARGQWTRTRYGSHLGATPDRAGGKALHDCSFFKIVKDRLERIVEANPGEKHFTTKFEVYAIVYECNRCHKSWTENV